MPIDEMYCGVECRVANSVMAVRAAHAVPSDGDGVSELLVAVRTGLDKVLREVADGTYRPSKLDASAALQFAREGAAFGYHACEIAPLIRIGLVVRPWPNTRA